MPAPRFGRKGARHPDEPDRQPKGGAPQHRDRASIWKAEDVHRSRSQSVTLKRGQNIKYLPKAVMAQASGLTTRRIAARLRTSTPRWISPLGLWRGFVFVGKLDIRSCVTNLQRLGYGQ